VELDLQSQSNGNEFWFSRGNAKLPKEEAKDVSIFLDDLADRAPSRVSRFRVVKKEDWSI